MNKITPSLWFSAFDGKLEEVIQYYKKVFGPVLVAGPIIPLGETPSGYTELCDIMLFDQRYNLMNTERPHKEFNDSISLIITCTDQNEIDKYWDYFTKEGAEVQCGWCIDKFGLRWQVIPENLDELMSRPSAVEIMMNQKKIIISEY